MLANSFSFLPVKRETEWYLVSDSEIACFLGAKPEQRKRRLGMKLAEAEAEMRLEKARTCCTTTTLPSALEILRESMRPILVTTTGVNDKSSEVIGVLTAFDVI